MVHVLQITEILKNSGGGGAEVDVSQRASQNGKQLSSTIIVQFLTIKLLRKGRQGKKFHWEQTI